MSEPEERDKRAVEQIFMAHWTDSDGSRLAESRAIHDAILGLVSAARQQARREALEEAVEKVSLLRIGTSYSIDDRVIRGNNKAVDNAIKLIRYLAQPKGGDDGDV